MSVLRNNSSASDGARSNLRSLRYNPPDMDNKKMDDLKSRIQGSATANGSTNGTDREGINQSKSYSPSRYVPLSERTGLSGYSSENISTRLSGKREARDAFFSGREHSSKFDPSSMREREKDKEREKDSHKEKSYSSGGGLPTIGGGGDRSHQSNKEIDGYVGFANLPNQVYRKAVKRGFEFTLMVVGESGLGKSTLINSMFLTDLYSAEHPGPSHRIKKTVAVEQTKVLLKEGGVQLRLTVVDTPGFGDAVDNSNCWAPVVDFIEHKAEEYLNRESRVNRKTMPDNRVHCCLYFISPNGHGLKPLDVEFMKRLHDKVNIIPLIAKADTLTPDECREFKKTILNEIAQHKIKIYEFPDCDDEEENKLQKRLKDRVPFAVVGSNTVVDSQGRKVRGRIYPWGVVEVENLEHNDFIALRNMLIRTHMQDLKDVTNNVHYENYRFNKLAAVTSNEKGTKTAGGTGKDDPPKPAVRRKKAERLKFMTLQSRSTNPLTLLPSGSLAMFGDKANRMSCIELSRTTSEGSIGGKEVKEVKEAPAALNVTSPKLESSVKNGLSFSDAAPLSNREMKERVALLISLSSKRNPLVQMEDERREHTNKMKKMEAEMEQVFEMKVKEKKQRLKDSEADLERRAEQMKKSLEQQQRELEEKRRQFQKEREGWEDQQKVIEEQRRRSLENSQQNQKKDKKKSLF